MTPPNPSPEALARKIALKYEWPDAHSYHFVVLEIAAALTSQRDATLREAAEAARGGQVTIYDHYHYYNIACRNVAEAIERLIAKEPS